MKKGLLLIVIIVFCISLVSCGSNITPSNQAQAEPTEEELIEAATTSALITAINNKKYIIENDDSRGGYVYSSYFKTDNAKMSITSIKDYTEHGIDCWVVKGTLRFYNDYNENVKIDGHYYLYFAVIVDKKFNSKCVHLWPSEPDSF